MPRKEQGPTGLSDWGQGIYDEMRTPPRTPVSALARALKVNRATIYVWLTHDNLDKLIMRGVESAVARLKGAAPHEPVPTKSPEAPAQLIGAVAAVTEELNDLALRLRMIADWIERASANARESTDDLESFELRAFLPSLDKPRRRTGNG
jgi:hypothetical protein